MEKVITKEELYASQFDYQTLKTLVMTYSVSMLDILKTQKLCAGFCIKYIMNEAYRRFDEDKYITYKTIQLYQPHIEEGELVNALLKATNKLSRGERIDSVDDFETYMDKHL